MTLLFGSLTAILLGLGFGWRPWTAALLGVVWYVSLAAQTAYLAHPGRGGFLHVDALRAVQGAGFAQYWLSQPVILAATAALMWSASRLRRQHLNRRASPSPQPGPARTPEPAPIDTP